MNKKRMFEPEFLSFYLELPISLITFTGGILKDALSKEFLRSIVTIENTS